MFPSNPHFKLMVLLSTTIGRDLFTLKDRYKRFPLKMDSPERVLLQMHGQARPIADFLHENGKYPSLFICRVLRELIPILIWGRQTPIAHHKDAQLSHVTVQKERETIEVILSISSSFNIHFFLRILGVGF